MKKTNEIVQRIESHYVGDECIQLAIPYRNAITILDQDGILFHDKIGSNLYINKYLEDERRSQFPYSNIPIYYSKKMFKGKIYNTNQLLDFEKPYISIGDNQIIERFVVKDGGQALLIKKIMKMDKYTRHMTYDELLKLTEKNDTDDQTYYVYLDGAVHLNDGNLFPTEERIYNHIKSQFEKNIKDFREYQEKNSDIVSIYLRNYPYFLDYMEQSISNHIDLSLIDFNIGVGYGPFLIIRIDNSNITIQGINATFIRQDDYKVDIYNIPVNDYTLEQLKFMPKINITKEPKIPLKLNPGVTRQDIQEAKQMVKTLRK